MTSWLDAAADEIDPEKRRDQQYADGGFIAAPVTTTVFVGGKEQERVLTPAEVRAQSEAIERMVGKIMADWDERFRAYFRKPTVRLRRAWWALRGR